MSFFCLILKKKEMDCLEKIIGITKDECECLQQNMSQEEKDELKVSKSGLYLEELEGGVFLRDVAKLDKCKTFIKIQQEAIETSKKHYKTDLFARLNDKYKVKKSAFIGEIGKPAYSGTLDVSKRLQFIRLNPNKDSDAIIHLENIRVFLNEDTTTKIWLYELKENESFGQVLLENDVTSVNQVLNIAVNSSLPLKKNGVFVSYFVIFERLGSVKPRNLKISCGCSGGDAFAQFLNVSGGETENFTSLNNEKKDVFTHGFSLDVKIKCESGNLVCREYDGNDSVAMVTAFAILYKSGELVIEGILNSGEVNRFTMLNKEHLWGKRNHFRKEYSQRIEWLANSIDVSSSDCFICRSDSFFLGNIKN